jgi:proline iminopeptidase
MEGIWGFQLNELPGGRTRLVISGYQTYRPRWIQRFVADWVVLPTAWIMQARMLVMLKRNIEGSTRAQVHTVTVSQDDPANSHNLSATARSDRFESKEESHCRA